MTVTGAQWRKFACALPEAEEKSHFGQPDFRVRNKIFAGMSPDGKQGTLKCTPELQAMLLDAKPNVFTPAAGAWGDKGWTRVVLAQLELGAVPELLFEAWKLVAPKTLLAARSSMQLAAAKPQAAKPQPARKSAKTKPVRKLVKAKPQQEPAKAKPVRKPVKAKPPQKPANAKPARGSATAQSGRRARGALSSSS
jgi:hypothetical protein